MAGTLRVYAFSAAAAALGENMVAPYMPLFIASFTSSPFGVGLLVAAVSLGGLLSQLFWGFSGDSLGRRKPFMIFGNAFKGLFYLVVSGVVSLKQLLFAQSAQSFLGGMHPPNGSALLAKLTEPDRRSRAAAAIDTVGRVFAVPAIFLGAWIVGRYGIRAVFIPAGIFLALAGAAFLALREPVGNGEKAGLLSRKVASELGSNRGFRFMLLGTFVWAFGMNMVSPLVPAMIFAVKLHFTAGELALLSLVSTLTALALTVPAGVLADRHGGRRLIALAYALGTVIILGYIFASSLAQVAVLVFLSAVAGAAGGGATFSLLCRLAPSAVRGSLMGLFALVVGLTQAVAPALGGFLWENAGFSLTFSAAALLHLAGGLVIYSKIPD